MLAPLLASTTIVAWTATGTVYQCRKVNANGDQLRGQAQEELLRAPA